MAIKLNSLKFNHTSFLAVCFFPRHNLWPRMAAHCFHLRQHGTKLCRFVGRLLASHVCQTDRVSQTSSRGLSAESWAWGLSLTREVDISPSRALSSAPTFHCRLSRTFSSPARLLSGEKSVRGSVKFGSVNGIGFTPVNSHLADKRSLSLRGVK